MKLPGSLRFVSIVLWFKIIGGLLLTAGGILFMTLEFNPGTTGYVWQSELREASGTQTAEQFRDAAVRLSGALAAQITISFLALQFMKERRSGWMRATLLAAIGLGLRHPDAGLLLSISLLLATFSQSSRQFFDGTQPAG